MADASSTLERSPPEPAPSGQLQPPPPARTQVLLDWLAGQPLVPPALGLVAGIAMDAAWPVPFIATLALFIAAGLAIWWLRDRAGLRHLMIALAACCVGAMLHDAAYRRWPSDSIVRYCGDAPLPARLTGTVLSAPLVRHAQTGRVQWFEQPPITRLLISAESLEGVGAAIPVEGHVSVKVHEPVHHVRPGDRAVIVGRLYRPLAAEAGEERDWVRISRRRGVLVQMTCDHDENVTVLPQKPSGGWLRGLNAVRRRARLAMLDHTWPGEVPGSNLLEALVLGQRSAVDPAINQAFVDTGTVHYLSVSGAHVGLLAGALWWVTLPFRRSPRWAALWIALIITVYGTLAEPNPPVWRSVIMGDLLCLAIILRRPLRVPNWLALSAIVLLVLSPTQLFEPGFQLSFATLISLIYLGPLIGRVLLQAARRLRGVNDPLLSPEIQRLFNPGPLRRLGWWVERFVTSALGVGIAAWLAGAAPGAYHFHQVSLWGWINSLLLAAPVALVLDLGLLKTVLGAIWPPLGALFGPLLTICTDLLVSFVWLLTRLPGSPLPPLHVTAPGVAATSSVLLIWVLRPWLRCSARSLGALTLAFAVIAAWRLAPRGPSGELRIDILSVGSGSAHLIRLPRGPTLLYDVGARPPYDIQRWTLGPLLARNNIYKLDALVLSHPDLDHFSSVPDLLDRTWQGGIITSELFRPLARHDAASGRIVRELDATGSPWRTLRRGQTLAGTGEVRVECLWPPPAGELPLTLTTNDSSLVLRITWQDRRILLCGDIEEYAQHRLIRESDIRADILILPHHGAMTASTGAFIAAVDPAWCIRSSGQRDAETRSGLLRVVAGRRYLNTADVGDIAIHLTPDVLSVTTGRPAR